MAEAREHPLDVEALQERLTTARRQVALEREQRAHAEHLARGLVELSTVSTPEQLAELLVKITKNILDCDAVIVSGPHGGPLQAREHTHAALSSLSWARDEFVERVLGGRPVIVARADRHPLWRAEPASVRDVVGSALHARVFDDADEGSVMLVAVHGERGYFGREHARRIELIRASLEQAWRRGLAVEREARLRHQAEVANERLRLAQSELLAARDSAERASHAKSAFLAQMSHELRTPLAGIIGLTQLALDGDDLGDEPRSLIGTARECAQHLLQVLNDILDLSKVEAGRLELEAIPLDVSELARQVIELVRVRADEKGLALDLDLELEPAACRRIGDPLRLKQVLFNLLSNGIKFTERGRVALRVQAGEGSTLRFEVRDTGIGVAPEKLTTIFEAFHQADNSTTRRFGGSGLGLAICRQLVKRFGGEIGATSELGVGSCFVFTVPLALATQREPAGRAATVGRAATGRAVTGRSVTGRQVAPAPRGQLDRPLRVLIAEDNPVNQLVARKMLERRGCEVVVVADGREAVDAVKSRRAREPFDMVLMDVQMPRLDGFAATREIRALGERELLVVALTANAMSGERERCIARGMDEYLAKPLDESRLDEVLALASPRSRADASTVPSVAQTR